MFQYTITMIDLGWKCVVLSCCVLYSVKLFARENQDFWFLHFHLRFILHLSQKEMCKDNYRWNGYLDPIWKKVYGSKMLDPTIVGIRSAMLVVHLNYHCVDKRIQEHLTTRSIWWFGRRILCICLVDHFVRDVSVLGGRFTWYNPTLTRIKINSWYPTWTCFHI